ncbi:methionyl-tRNA formyltransferase [Pestalotiopsis sp. NC0098]|nr:methionyl-tRNA formyltransferase [Pestalotiopsis sp. NC0098]
MKLRLRSLLVAARTRPVKAAHTVESWLAPLWRDATTTCRRFQSHQSKQKTSEPLRILFCGSDDFSSANLRALREEQLRNPGLIESIDVVVRPGKRVGRGNKRIQHPPIRDVATELNLTIHERDTFTDWSMPSRINLIVAVSFGLFVPARLLRAARYGGLNVHPSLLPEFRGAAPLHHALLAGRPATGVTLQTLDDKTFDAGVVLDQTPLDRLVPIEPGRTNTVPELLAALTPVATDMLVRSLREGRHVPPLRAVGWQQEQEQGRSDGSRRLLPDATALAPKITPQMRQLVPPPPAGSDVPVWTAGQAVLRQNVIGPLWFRALERQHGQVKRVIVDGPLEEVALGKGDERFDPLRGAYKKLAIHRSVGEQGGDVSVVSVVFWVPHDGECVYLVESRTAALKIGQLKIEGEKAKPAGVVLEHLESEVVDENAVNDEYVIR